MTLVVLPATPGIASAQAVLPRFVLVAGANSGGTDRPLLRYAVSYAERFERVLTDVRQTTATLVLAASLEGRVFVRNARQDLVVELYKAEGHPVELRLEPGTYEVRIERPPEAWVAKCELGTGQRIELALDQLSPTKPEPARPRGIEAPRYSVAGRNRIELRVGLWRGT
jgi:hypothetical protein